MEQNELIRVDVPRLVNIVCGDDPEFDDVAQEFVETDRRSILFRKIVKRVPSGDLFSFHYHDPFSDEIGLYDANYGDTILTSVGAVEKVVTVYEPIKIGEDNETGR